MWILRLKIGICSNGSRPLGKNFPQSSGGLYGLGRLKALYVFFIKREPVQGAFLWVHDCSSPIGHIPLSFRWLLAPPSHIYWQSPLLQPYWRSVQDLIQRLFDLDIPLSPKIFLLGLLPPSLSRLAKKLTHSLTTAAWCLVALHWKQQVPPSSIELYAGIKGCGDYGISQSAPGKQGSTPQCGLGALAFARGPPVRPHSLFVRFNVSAFYFTQERGATKLNFFLCFLFLLSL